MICKECIRVFYLVCIDSTPVKRFLHLIISMNIILDKYLMIYIYIYTRYINLIVTFFTNLNKQYSVSHVARCNVHAIQRNKYWHETTYIKNFYQSN